jgi:hypothetical protein
MNNNTSKYAAASIPFMMEGQVIATNDPDQMGRLKVWVPALDGENFNEDELPWTDYASPFSGFTVDMPAGGTPVANSSHAAYGMWAIPKIGATVIIFCLNADPSARFYFACTTRLHRNRSLPAGRNFDVNGKEGPFGDAGDESGNLNPIQPAYANLREQFQDKTKQSESITRGFYERQVAQAKSSKDGTEGYSESPVDSYLDPQTSCWVSPGRHAIIFQDDPKRSRFRIKTAEGHQVIFDDANERIYISTAKGKSWVEMDQDGHINIFGSDSISVRSGKDINFFADRDINLEADRAVNIKANNGDIRLNTTKSFQVNAGESIVQSACGIFDINSEKSLKITAAMGLDVRAGTGLKLTGDSTVDIKAGSMIRESATRIDLNGPPAQTAEKASCAKLAEPPTVVPGHEPWTRPVSDKKRGPNWKQ